MTASLPSKEIYAVDVPETKKLSAVFKYNFFVPDESVSDSGGMPTNIISKPSSEQDSAFIQHATVKTPRFVVINWDLPKISDVGGRVTDSNVRGNVFGSGVQDGTLIRNNIDKVMTEDQFSSETFVACTFHDGEIDNKLFQLVSGSLSSLTLDTTADADVSHQKAAMQVQALTPGNVKPTFLVKSLANPKLSSGLSFHDAGGNNVVDNHFEQLKAVVSNAQVNSKLLHDITSRSIKDPNSPFASDLINMFNYSKKLKNSVSQRFTSAVSETDFKTFVKYIDIDVNPTAVHHDNDGPELVGFIIDKTEVLPDGSIKNFDQIIIDNPKSSLVADFKVRYNSRYVYSIRSVGLFTLPAIDDSAGSIAMLKVLISSKPSNKVYCETTEMVAPPPPAESSFMWDYEKEKLIISWSFPVNSQRDIKKFQVFRRDSIDHPFELLKQYDFDDSVVKFPDMEDPDPKLIESLRSPSNTFIDDEFTKQSKFIYALASIDAHGLTSAFSAQFELGFDLFKNKLTKTLISHSGAPKPYPNLYLEGELFVDAIKVSGPNSKKAKLYFNPEFYYLYDDQQRLQQVLSTKQTGGSYKANFVNLDTQTNKVMTVTIDDQLDHTNHTLSVPEIRYGKRNR